MLCLRLQPRDKNLSKLKDMVKKYYYLQFLFVYRALTLYKAEGTDRDRNQQERVILL